MNVLRNIFLIILFAFTNVVGQNSLNNSAFGKVFTPKGDLRILIIYAGFDGFDKKQGYHNWGFGNDMPVYDPKELFFNDFNSFQTSTLDSFPSNLSGFYYQFSNKENPFRIIADVLPKRINIDPSTARSFGDCNRLVMEKMMAEFPDFDWKPYDSRKNMPKYKFDNSVSEPDNKPDYVIIAYRYAPGWPIQPKAGMQNWAANYSRLDGLHNVNFNGYNFDGAGFTLAGFEGKTSQFKGLFIHELAHELYSCPHYSGTNNALGNYFHLPTIGWDMMNLLAGFSCNAFERWLLGWKEIKHDLKDVTDNGTYDLNDYVTTGDAVRIKIPHTENQYLWIENHQKKSVLDEKQWKGSLKDKPKGSPGIPAKETGVYMYIESVLDDRTKITEGIVYDLNKVNGILPLHAGGNYDYEKPDRFTVSPDEYWNNKLLWFKRANANPVSGINPFINFRHDMDSNGVINQVPGNFGEFNGLKDCECYPIVKEIISGQPILTYANLGGRTNNLLAERRSDAFQKGDVLNLSSNPMIINRPVYDKKKDKLTPFYLNGISVEIIDFNEGTATIRIAFDNITVNNNVRWCGNIVCKPSDLTEKHDLVIGKNINILLDLSATPNKLKTPFVNPTIFSVDSGAVVFLSEGSSFTVKEGSTFKIKKGGKVIIDKNAFLGIDKDSFLEVEEGGEITFLNKGSVIYLNSNSLKINIKDKVLQNGNFKKKRRIK